MITYPYIYSAISCDLTFGFVQVDNSPVYIVGSEVELISGQTISIHDITSPSKTQCVTIISDTTITGSPTHVYAQSYDDCVSCLSATTSIAIAIPCNNTIEEFNLPIYVSNLYNVGDIISIPPLIYTSGETQLVFYYNDCFTIIAIEPFSESIPLPQPYVVEYSPKQSCEECTSCLGILYEYYDCNAEEGGVLLSHQKFGFGDTIYFETGSTNCKQVSPLPPVLEDISYSDYETYLLNPPVITSTISFTGENGCEQCENSLGNGLVWQNQIDGDGTINFLNQYEVDILGPNDNDNNGWSYIKVQMPIDGTISFNYSFTTNDSIEYDWGFYYVSSNEPFGNNNINFNYGKFTFNNNESGTQTISFNAGDWVSIGVYSTDSCCGPGLLSLLFEPFNLYTHNSYDFISCYGETGTILLPLSARTLFHNVKSIPYVEISSDGLDEMPINEQDDDYIEIPLPSDFTIDFLCKNYSSVFLSTNGYLTFDGGNSECCFTIPNGIPSQVKLSGVFISNAEGIDSITTGMDSVVFNWYSGLTESGSKFVIKYEGTYYNPWDNGCEGSNNCPPFVFSFIFYSGISTYFDLVIQNNTIFYDNNPTGGLSDGINGGWIKSFNSGSKRSYRISVNCPVFKANFGTKPSICGTIGTLTSIESGSMYFDNQEFEIVQVDNSSGAFGFNSGNDLTIEWFQYLEGGTNVRPFSIGTYGYGNVFIQVSYEGNGLLWIGDGNGAYTTYDLGINLLDLQNIWVHIAITRFYDNISGDRTWRFYVNGVKVLEQIDNTIATTFEPLTIGNQLTNDGQFQGYITNFRVNDQTALYTGNSFDVPTSPLTNIPNTILLLLSVDSSNLITDTTGLQTVSIPEGPVVWSNKNPFSVSNTISLGQLYSDINTTYDTCQECKTLNTATLKNCSTDEIIYVGITPANIYDIQTLGPIFSNGGTECYEMLDYCTYSNDNEIRPVYFYSNCETCNQPLSAGTEYKVCVICCPCTTGSTITEVSPPHATWTNLSGKAVVLNDTVVLGGMNGLNS